MLFLTETPFVSIWKSPNEIFLYITLAFWLPFFKSPRLKQPIFYSFFLSKSSFYAVCLIKKQNLSMLYAILRNPNFTSALFIPMVLRMRFPARCVMLPNTCSILERVLALVRFPCFSHEVRGCPLYPSMLGFVKLLLQLFPVFFIFEAQFSLPM